MRIITKKYTLYITLKQCFAKFKKAQLLYDISTFNLLFVTFLWKKNYIYGYTKLNYSQKIYLYLKYDSFHGYGIKKDTKIYTFKNLYKLYLWEKNIFIILKTTTGLYTPKEAFIKKIGGYSLYKLS